MVAYNESWEWSGDEATCMAYNQYLRIAYGTLNNDLLILYKGSTASSDFLWVHAVMCLVASTFKCEYNKLFFINTS